MFFRVIFAAIIGGALMFGCGFVEHMMLDWTGRHMKNPSNEAALREAIKSSMAQPGVYGIPSRPAGFDKMSKDEQKQAYEELSKVYKEHGGAFIVVAPTGQDMMSQDTLIKEAGSNLICAFLASLVVAMTRPSIGFVGRLLVVVFIGVFAWAAVNASYHIWYRFPLEYVQDELYCAALEAAVAGVAIAAIVVPRDRPPPGF